MVEEDDFEEVFRLLADDLSQTIRRDAYKTDIERINKLSTAYEKLIFIFTIVFQPQHYSSYRRILGIRSEKTLDKSLQTLEAKGFMTKDTNQFWWIKHKNQ